MSKNSKRFQGSLDIIFRKSINGPFPVGTLHTELGSFACRDKWLETLDSGTYQGDFDITEITLSGYMTKRPHREQRTFIKAVVSAYYLDSIDEQSDDFEMSNLDDPMLDEMVTSTPPQLIESSPLPIPQWVEAKDNEVPEMVLFIRGQLQSTGYDAEWQDGQPFDHSSGARSC